MISITARMSGCLVSSMMRAVCAMAAVDLSAENLARAEARARESGVSDRFTTRQSDAERLPFDDGSFDVVLYFVRGPSHITASSLGKATTATTATLLVLTAFVALTRPSFVDPAWIRIGLHALSVLLGISLVHLVYRAFKW